MALGNPVAISPTVQKAYRDALQCAESPSFLDPTLPIQPVAIIAQAAGSSSTQISDGTDTLLVNTDGSINVTGTFAAGLPVPSASQTLIKTSNGLTGTAVTAGTGSNIRTTTASKTFYLTHIVVLVASAGTGNGFELYDAGSKTGSPVFVGDSSRAASAASAQSYAFPTPLAFTTGVFLDSEFSTTLRWAISGFEQ